MKFRTVPVLAMLISLALLGRTWGARSSSASLDDPAQLRALAEHFAGVRSPEDELIVGSLPDSLPPELLPIPNNARILGSVAQGGDYIRVVLDSTQPTSTIESFYEERLLNAGWRIEQFPVFSWGFTSAGQVKQPGGFSHRFFCSDAENTSVQILTSGRQAGQPFEINIQIPIAASYCGRNTLPTLPKLQLPVSVSMSSGGSMGGGNSLFANAVVTMSIASEALLSHLAEQFGQAGWAPVERIEDDILSWASWIFEDEQGDTWQSELSVIKLQDISDRYVVRAQVEKQVN